METNSSTPAPAPAAEVPQPTSSAAYPWLLRTYTRKKQQQPDRKPEEMASDLDRCTRRAITSYAKRVEAYHPKMAADARAYAKSAGAEPGTMAKVIDRLQWALHEEGERVRNFFMPKPK